MKLANCRQTKAERIHRVSGNETCPSIQQQQQQSQQQTKELSRAQLGAAIGKCCGPHQRKPVAYVSLEEYERCRGWIEGNETP